MLRGCGNSRQTADSERDAAAAAVAGDMMMMMITMYASVATCKPVCV